MDGHLSFTGNRIDSSANTTAGTGIGTGLFVGMEPSGAGDMSVTHSDFAIVRSLINSCTGDGIWLRNDPQGPDTANHISVFNFTRNRVIGCGGAGLRIQRNDVDSAGGYVNVESVSNWFVKNHDGVRIEGDAGNKATGAYFVNDTIAYNSGDSSTTGYGFVIRDAASNGLHQISNCIVYGNNSNGIQYDAGSTGWTPLASYTTTEYSDFQNLSGGTGNIDADPDFVSVSTGDFHLLDDASPCVDTGINNPNGAVVPGEFDIDSADRVVDGDGDTSAIIDMGADEYDPEA